MDIRESYSDRGPQEVRELGKAMLDKAMFEVDVTSGAITWSNAFAAARLGYTMGQLLNLSVFDLSPPQFHERLREESAEGREGRTQRFSLRPMRTSAGTICWWYVYQVRSHLPFQWLFAEHIQDTPTSGAEFSFMSMQMETVNSQASLEARIEDLDEWVRQQVKRLDGDVESMRREFQTLSDKADSAVRAAKTAANNSLDSKNASNALQSRLDEQFGRLEESQANLSAEVMKLISTDSIQDRRIKAFEAHVRETTLVAVQAIERQASRAGKGLSRKVTVPVGVIAGLAALLQLIIQHWTSIIGLFR